MKNLIILLLLSPLIGLAQVDSAKIKINISIQARDAEYIGSFIANQEVYESSYDVLKKKFRVQSPPANNTMVAMDSITVWEWYRISDIIRKDYIAIQAGIFTRLDTSLRAKNNAYLTKLLNEANAFDKSSYQTRRNAGRNRLRKI